MATPNTKASLKEHCLRSLGKPVIEINVDDDQIDDRIDDALQYFAQYHYDGIERVYLKHKITQAEIDRAKTNASATATDTADNSITATWLEGKNFIPVPDTVLSVVKVFDFTDKHSLNITRFSPSFPKIPSYMSPLGAFAGAGTTQRNLLRSGRPLMR